MRWVVGPILTVIAASLLVAAALSIAPGDPAAHFAGTHPTPEHLEAIRQELHLNESFFEKYWHWLTHAAHGDFGASLLFRTPVTDLISARLKTTIFLTAYGGILILVFGLGLGLIGGLSRRLGPVVAAVSGLAIAIPSFVASLLLVQIFSLNLGLFPAIGAGSGFIDRLWHLTLPAIALALSLSAFLTQISRAAIREEESREHVETARGRGLPSRLIVSHHVLRNAALPIVTLGGILMAGLIASTVIVESAFGLDGIGSLLVKSTTAKDYNVVQAITLILVVAFVIVSTLIDIAQRALDPRIRRGSKR